MQPTRALAFRLSVFYGTLFLAVGLLGPYWPMWLESRGMEPGEIGLLMSASLLTRAIANPAIGALVDRRGDRRRPMLVLAAMSLGAYALFVPARGFWQLMALTVLSAASFTALMPVGDSLTLLAAAERRLHYGRIRLWGSLTFIVASIAGGAVIERQPMDTLPWLINATLAILIGACAVLPDVRVDRPVESAPGGERTLRRLAVQPVFVLFLGAASAVHASHVVYYGFGALHWQAAGLSLDAVGLLWAEGVLAEVVVFACSAVLLRRMTAPRLLALAGLAAAARWIVLSFTTDALALILVQSLHGFSFGACHLGALHFMDRAVHRSASASAQTLYGAIATGLLPGVAMLGVGRLYGALAGAAYLVAAAVALLAVILAFLLDRRWNGGELALATRPAHSR
ncbi:MAG TPA: MFS transporter [Haliangium sp.]|nr:MFS transporter [Haliangium sp.]